MAIRYSIPYLLQNRIQNFKQKQKIEKK